MFQKKGEKKSHSTILQRLRHQISLDYYTIPPATQVSLIETLTHALNFGNCHVESRRRQTFYATCTYPIMHLIAPQICITFVFHFSWVSQPSQGTLKTILYANIWGQIGALWEMCKWRIHVQVRSDVRLSGEFLCFGQVYSCILNFHPTSLRKLSI